MAAAMMMAIANIEKRMLLSTLLTEGAGTVIVMSNIADRV